MDIPLCDLDEFGEAQVIGREVTFDGRTIAVIVSNLEQNCTVFLNSCPHTGVQLQWRPDDFLDQSNTYFQCAMHGALFKTDSGVCIAGPCTGASLVALKSEVRDGTVYLNAKQNIPDSARAIGITD